MKVKRQCDVCDTTGPPPKQQKEVYAPAAAGYPMARLCIDFVGPLPKASGGERYILTVLDTFSRWLEAFPTKDG